MNHLTSGKGHKMWQQLSQADVRFIMSATLAGATWVTHLAVWLQIAASAIAIAAGFAAIWYHVERAHEYRRQRKIRERDAKKK